MKRLALFILSLFFAVPMLVGQSLDHVEVGAFANYLRLTDSSPVQNYIGVGGSGAFGLSPNVQLEAEMAYNFTRNYTNTFSNGVTTQLVTSRNRVLEGYFGPKFQTGGPFSDSTTSASVTRAPAQDS